MRCQRSGISAILGRGHISASRLTTMIREFAGPPNGPWRSGRKHNETGVNAGLARVLTRDCHGPRRRMLNTGGRTKSEGPWPGQGLQGRRQRRLRLLNSRRIARMVQLLGIRPAQPCSQSGRSVLRSPPDFRAVLFRAHRVHMFNVYRVGRQSAIESAARHNASDSALERLGVRVLPLPGSDDPLSLLHSELVWPRKVPFGWRTLLKHHDGRFWLFKNFELFGLRIESAKPLESARSHSLGSG